MSFRTASPARLFARDRMHLYLFVSVLFVMGVIFGALMVNALTLEQKRDLAGYMGNFLQASLFGGEAAPRPSLAETFGLHFKWLALLWLLGISVVGLPLVLALDFLKGLLVGFTVGVLISQYAWKGLALAFVSVVPHNMVIVPVIIASSAASIAFSIMLVKRRFLQRPHGSAAPTFVSYTAFMIAMAAVVFAVSLFETYVTPRLIQWIAPIVLGGAQ